MVRPEGLEPSTVCLEGRCSIQLSYGRSKPLHHTRRPWRDLVSLIDPCPAIHGRASSPGETHARNNTGSAISNSPSLARHSTFSSTGRGILAASRAPSRRFASRLALRARPGSTLGLRPTGSDPTNDRTHKLVGVERFELPTSCSQSRRATRLRYTPKTAGG